MTSRTNAVLVTGATGWLGGHILAALRCRTGVTVIAACRSPERLPAWFDGETRVGDLSDEDHRHALVADVDVILHAGTWSSFWGHAEDERRLFLEPTIDLIDQAIEAGVRRFVAASTVALSTPAANGDVVDDASTPVKRGFWPHLDYLVEVDAHMRERAGATEMVTLRLGHFVGEGNKLGLVPAIIPRLKTRLVPWVSQGSAHLPLVAGEDLGEAFALAATASGLAAYESINIVGPTQPTAREVFTFIAERAGVPKPAYSVPLRVAHVFGGLMELLNPVAPGKSPFLTRSLVHVGEKWHAATDAAREKLGYEPSTKWQEAVAESIEERRARGFAWPELRQTSTTADVSQRPSRPIGRHVI